MYGKIGAKGFFCTTMHLYINQWSKSTLTNTLDLSPPDFFLFPQLKIVLKGKKFASNEEYTAKTTRILKEVLKNGFQKCFQNHYECWQKCGTAQGI
jgi:hypothetical protein